MQRLTLILSDLYLPEEGVSSGFPQSHELPELRELLRIAQGPGHIGDWRRWLLSQVSPRRAGWPLAQICAAELLPGAGADTAWLATPVSLEARLDHVRMVDRGLLHLDAGERAAWCAEFNRVFGPQFSLHDGGGRAFILVGLPGTAEVADPARLLGDEIGPALPGSDAPELRRLWAEIEMWLHGSAQNEARERARQRRVSALWLWGRSAELQAARAGDDVEFDAYGGDPLLVALESGAGSPRQDSPAALEQVAAASAHVIAEFAPLTGQPPESLPALDTHWFAAARQKIANGRLSLLEIIANDRCFRITPHARWRVWRRRRGWLESLAS